MNWAPPVDPEALWRDMRDAVRIQVANAVEWLVDPHDRTEREDLWRMFFARVSATWADWIADDGPAKPTSTNS